MSDPNFEDDIKPIFADYRDCMKDVVIADDEGAVTLDLADYEIVKRFSEQIKIAINGFRKPGTTRFPMPRTGPPLPDEKIDLFEKWADGKTLESSDEPEPPEE